MKMVRRMPYPRYGAFDAEMMELRRKGLSYVASCPVSFQVIAADDAKRRGNLIEAQSLEGAGRAVALAQARAIDAMRRMHVRLKPMRSK